METVGLAVLLENGNLPSVCRLFASSSLAKQAWTELMPNFKELERVLIGKAE
jgi:hypothetical protein